MHAPLSATSACARVLMLLSIPLTLSAPSTFQAELISRDTVVPIVPLAVIPLDDGLCNASKTNATQPECVCTWVVWVCCVLDVSVVWCLLCVCVYVSVTSWLR